MGNKPDLADETVRNEVQKKDNIILVTREQTSCKARGTDNVPAKILKKDLETTVELLHLLLRRSGRKEWHLKAGSTGCL